MRYFKLKTTGAAAIAAALLLAGCAKETEVDGGWNGNGNGTPVSGDEVTVMMTLNIPGAAGTRGLSDTQEKNVNNVDIFVFDKDLKLIDWQYGELENNAGDVSFSATLRASRDNDDKFRLMVLANVRQTTYGLFSGANFGGHKGKTYAEVRALLQATVPTYSDLSSKGFPMWGEIEDMVLLTGTSNSYSMDLLRSLSRIDIGTHPNPTWQASGQIAGWAALGNFSLEEVYVYNANTHYALAADRGNYNFTDKKVSAYSLPSTATKAAAMRYSDGVLPGTVTRTGGTGVSVTAGIYTGEANVKMGTSGSYADVNHANRMALVVGGYYSDAPDPSKLCYYRLDFLEGTNGATLMDVLRNGNYQIVINNVGGPGSETKEEAFRKFNANMVVVVNRWSDAGQAGTTVSGEHYLRVNPYDIEVDKWDHIKDIKIETNVPATGGKSWSAAVAKVDEGDDDPAWLTITEGTNTGVSGGVLEFNVAQVPGGFTDADSRSARIVITAGTMDYSLIVTQTGKDGDHMLRLSHSEFVFAGRKWNGQTWVNPDPQEISVNWGPHKFPYTLDLSEYTGGGVKMVDGSVPADSNDPRLAISPVMIADNDPNLAANPFFERSSRLAFTASNTDGLQFITKQVLIRQVYYSLVISGTKDYYYQGNSYEITLRANSPWTATVNDGSLILEGVSGTSGTGSTATTGEKFKFKIRAGAAIDAWATVTFSSPTNLFPPQTIKIIAQDVLPNCEVVAPGGGAVLQVRKAYRVWELDRDLYNDDDGRTLPSGTYEAVLLWQDAKDLIGNVILTGNGRNAQIMVTTKNSTTKGNAVVAYRNATTNEIYWSWHIWVTPDDPNDPANQGSANGYTFMDRNLGAFGTSGYDAYGLMYQGGRKDPFPPAATTSGTTRKIIYDIGNNIRSYDQIGGIINESAPAQNGVLISIHNPMSNLMGTYGNTYWYGLLIDTRIDLWENGAYKSDYDPCPKGWMVPNQVALNGLNSLPLGTMNFMWNEMYWPSQGFLLFNATTISGNGNTCHVWCTQYASWSIARIISTTNAGSTNRLSNSNNLRCVKDE